MSDYEVFLGRNISAARGRLRLSQASVAARMKALGFSQWHQQTAGSIERADRRVTALEVLGLSIALETTVRDLMTPPQGELVTLPGTPGERFQIGASRFEINDGALTWDKDEPVMGAPRMVLRGIPRSPDADWRDEMVQRVEDLERRLREERARNGHHAEEDK